MRLDKSKELFKKAEQFIPCQTQTLSKGYTQFVQGISPVFLKRGKGSHVWDVDGNEFIDFVLALGPVTLGYDYLKVNSAIIDQLKEGISFSMPHPLEVQLAEKLTEIIPCSEMVRFSKNGTDVTSAAIRLARSFTGKEKIAYCGYHGGSVDWFGITTLLNKGIPKIMKDLIFKFEYNDIKTLEEVFEKNKNNIAAVIIEPVIYEEPKEDFLKKVKEITHKNKAILIFDEMITGFRVSLGGAQEYFKVTPDLATFGKGVANGMPLSILTGKREIMQECENIFFSMTFGGETLSLAAARAVIDEMEDKNVIEHLWKQGSKLKDNYNDLAKKYHIDQYTKCIGLPIHSQFEFKNNKGEIWYALKSLFLQETIERGILFSCVNNICFSHSDEDIHRALIAIEESFRIIEKAVAKNNVDELIKGVQVQPVFRTTGGNNG